jgi:trimethylamine:corrinoid methyltransferase-like protein
MEQAMRLQPGLLSRWQVQTIHANALRVLDEVGVRVSRV